jgi:galacturan 1,4-alpha-galacturonidase
LYAKDKYTLRPVLFGIDGLSNSIISNLVLRYSPQYYYFLANSTNVVFDNINIAGGSTNPNVTAKNTDGWDTYRSDAITIQNSVINNGDGKSFPIRLRCGIGTHETMY